MRLRQSYARHLLPPVGCPGLLRRILDTGRDAPTAAMSRGSAMHDAVLRGARLDIVEADNYRTKVAREQRDAILESGGSPVLRREADQILACVEHIRACIAEYCGVPWAQIECERTHVWTSPDGIECAGTPDARAPGITLDLKLTSHGMSPHEWDGIVYRELYDVQAAAYLEQLRASGEDGRHHHVMCLIEADSEQPLARFYPLGEAYLETGARRWARAKRIWAECLRTGQWPWWPSRPLTPPTWAIKQEAEQHDY